MGMQISYTRSSSYANFQFCEMQYYLTYNLGLYRPSSMKADMGSAVHKVLEWLAIAKKYIQDNPDCTEVKLNDKMSFERKDFLTETYLDNKQIDIINKARASKSIYKSGDVSVKYGHKRKGVEVVEWLIDESSKYFAPKSPEPWPRASFRDVNNWTWITLDYKGGIYDPRLRTIKCPEKHFDLKIEHDWAKYDYTNDLGIKYQGNFGIKGTVDLITELDSDTLEVVDWKTGQRLDWATGEVKTYDKLCNDTQLMMYYYALTKVFPEYENILISIFFVRDGGPFTMCFERHHIPIVEERLRKHFDEVRACHLPEMCSFDQSSFKCTRLCNYYKEKLPGTDVNTCRHIHNEIKLHGMDAATAMYKNPNFEASFYEAPGE